MNVARRVLNGENVPIEPSANSASKVTNNITVTSGEIVKYPQVSVFESPPEEPVHNFDKALSQVDKEILLRGDKVQLWNILSDNQIFLSKKQLEELITVKNGKSVNIFVSELEARCWECSSGHLLLEISSIRVLEKDSALDFKVAFNSDYVSLLEEHQISLKYVIA
jgi:hypothetical protein